MSWLTELEHRFHPDRGSQPEQQAATPGRQTRVETHAPAIHHDLPPPSAGEPPEVTNARAALLRTDLDASRQLAIIQRVFDLARTANPNTAQDLLRLIAPFGREYPDLTHAIAARLAELAPRGRTRGMLDVAQVADAERFNARFPSNIASFISATHIFSSVADVDVQRIAAWQKTHGLDPDGKVGSHTLAVAVKGSTSSSSSTSPTPASTTSASATPASTSATGTSSASTSSAGTSSTAASGGAAHIPPGDHPPEFYGGKRLVAAKNLSAAQALRRQQYIDDKARIGFVDAHDTTVSMADRMREITKLCPATYSRALRVLMVGQSRAEQDQNAVNYNFAGIEPYGRNPPTDGTPWTRALRSAVVSRSECVSHPDVYLNWVGGGRPFDSIEDQLATPAPNIYVMYYGPRPAYATLDAAVTSFVSEVTRRIDAHAKAGTGLDVKAAAGVETAYIEIMSKPIGTIGAYNGTAPYPGQLANGISIAKGDATIKAMP